MSSNLTQQAEADLQPINAEDFAEMWEGESFAEKWVILPFSVQKTESLNSLESNENKTFKGVYDPERYRYDPYGKRTVMNAGYGVLVESSVGQEFGYTGRRHDVEDTRLMYFRARYYSAELGSFVSRDPIEYDGGGMNLHAGYFVPASMDPTGLVPSHPPAPPPGTGFPYPIPPGTSPHNPPPPSGGHVGCSIGQLTHDVESLPCILSVCPPRIGSKSCLVVRMCIGSIFGYDMWTMVYIAGCTACHGPG